MIRLLSLRLIVMTFISLVCGAALKYMYSMCSISLKSKVFAAIARMARHLYLHLELIMIKVNTYTFGWL